MLSNAGGMAFDDLDGVVECKRFLMQRFSAFAELSATEASLVSGLAQTLYYHPAYRNLYNVGMMSPPLRMVVSGWACRYRLLSGGRRQILELRLPGDFIGQMPPLEVAATSAVASLTEMETVNARPVCDALARNEPEHEGLLRAVHRMGHVDDLTLCDQVVRLGRQSAGERLAHLMLRFHERLSRVGLAEGNRFAMPLTQDVLADVLGLSLVHMNRTVQLLRRKDLLDLRAGYATLLDVEQLCALADWAPLPRFS